jgi:DNA-binding CsgD family transcriptional regulator
MSAPPAPGAPFALVGRERELGVLRERLTAALTGHGGLVLISGEAGIGKTALAESLCHEAADQGALVLVGRCYDLTETPPYGPWVELFARYRQADGMPPPPEAFAVRGTVGEVTSQGALFEQIHDFLAALTAAHPAVLLLDDYHWADAASLDLLRFVARDSAALPLLVLVTYRSDELTRRHPLYALLPTLARESAATRLDLRHLDDDAVQTLVVARYGLGAGDATRLTVYLQERAEGNGLFLTELLRTLEEQTILHGAPGGWQVGDLRQVSVPALLRQVIDGRIARLGEAAQRLLTVAAIIGHEVVVDVWRTIAQSDEEELLALVERAADAHVLEESADGTTVRFSHALIRETLVAGVSAARRRMMQRRVGEALAALPNADPDAVAYHFQQAGDDRAAGWLLRAGERAQRAYAWITAAERFEAALALREREMGASERGWLLFRLARMRRFAATSQALLHIEEALALAEEAGDRVLAISARVTRGLLLALAGERRAGVRELAAAVEALDLLSPGDRDRMANPGTGSDAATLPGVWMLQAALTGHYAAVLVRAGGWATVAEPPRVPGQEDSAYGDGWYGLAHAYAMTGQTGAAEAAYARARAVFAAIGHHHLVAAVDTYVLLFVVLPYRADHPAERRRIAAGGAEEYERASSASVVPPALPFALLGTAEGRWEEGIAVLEAISYLGVMILAALRRERGERARAWESIDAFLPQGPVTEPGNHIAAHALSMQRTAAALALDASDLPLARAWLDAHDRWLAWSGAVLGQSEGQLLWAQYHRQAGDADNARAHAERALSHVTEPRQPLALLAAHRLLGELDTDAGRYDDAATHLTASLALAEACEAPYERALTLLAIAELQAATGQCEDATRRLDEVRAICAPLGAQPALARAAALAERLVDAPPTVPAHPAGLSAREVEVLRLVAQGMTNPQVAERLYLSPRTVEQHLRSIYNKLGVSTRAAATHFAVTHGLA